MTGLRTWRRRTQRVAVLGVAVLGVALLAAVSPAQAVPSTGGGGGPGTPAFSDSFDVSPDPAWTFHNRGGQVAGGELLIDGDYLPGSVGRDGWATTHAGATGWRNYTFSASYDTQNVGGSPDTVHMAFFFFRVVDPTPGSGTYYRLSVWDPDQASPQGGGGDLPDGLVLLERYVGGVATTLVDSPFSGTITGDNDIQIRVNGARIRVVANGTPIVSVVDPAPIRYGGVGVGQIWETNGAFDDVTVIPVRCGRPTR